MLQILKEAAGYAHTAPRGQCLGHLLPIKLVIVRAFLPGVRAGDKSFAHLLQELVHKDTLHFGADLGQVLARLSRILAHILQGMERAQARGPQGGGRHGLNGYTIHSLLLR